MEQRTEDRVLAALRKWKQGHIARGSVPPEEIEQIALRNTAYFCAAVYSGNRPQIDKAWDIDREFLLSTYDQSVCWQFEARTSEIVSDMDFLRQFVIATKDLPEQVESFDPHSYELPSKFMPEHLALVADDVAREHLKINMHIPIEKYQKIEAKLFCRTWLRMLAADFTPRERDQVLSKVAELVRQGRREILRPKKAIS